MQKKKYVNSKRKTAIFSETKLTHSRKTANRNLIRYKIALNLLEFFVKIYFYV